jgi:hypothetical protein
MGHLHGPVIDGVIHVDQRVKFTREVQSGLFYPWNEVWYADGTNGSTDFSGRGPSQAKASISQCITASSAEDIIYVRPLLPIQTDMTDPTPYAENLVIPVEKWGLSIIGAGNNPRNPFYTQVKANSAGYGVEIKAVSTKIENLDFNKGSATTGMIYLNGDNNTTAMAWGTLIQHCHIRNANSASNPGIKTYSGSYSTVYDCDFEACHTGMYISSGGTYPLRSLRIEDCRFKGSNASAVAGSNLSDGGTSAIIYEIEVLRCTFERIPTGNFVNFTANTYGIIAGCYWGDLAATVGTSSSDVNVPATVFVSGSWDDGAQSAT